MEISTQAKAEILAAARVLLDDPSADMEASVRPILGRESRRWLEQNRIPSDVPRCDARQGDGGRYVILDAITGERIFHVVWADAEEGLYATFIRNSRGGFVIDPHRHEFAMQVIIGPIAILYRPPQSVQEATGPIDDA